MADGRIVFPQTTFMRKGSGDQTWHLGPPYDGVGRDVDARCGRLGPWLFFIGSLDPAHGPLICLDCLQQAGISLDLDHPGALPG